MKEPEIDNETQAMIKELEEKIAASEKAMMNDLKERGIVVLALHPGHVKTDMGGSAAPLVPEESIRGMISVIDSITEADSGKFLDWEGGEIPW